MAFRMKTKVDKLDKYIKAAEQLKGKSVQVGVLSGENAWLASIHEYGCEIPVTDKMRAYLHRIGVHLKSSTKKIVIPERSFLRNGYDEHKATVLRHADKLLPDVLSGKVSIDTFFETVGGELRDLIKEYAIELKDPPKQEWPTRDPAKNNPLVMTGDMIGGIEYEVADG